MSVVRSPYHNCLYRSSTGALVPGSHPQAARYAITLHSVHMAVHLSCVSPLVVAVVVVVPPTSRRVVKLYASTHMYSLQWTWPRLQDVRHQQEIKQNLSVLCLASNNAFLVVNLHKGNIRSVIHDMHTPCLRSFPFDAFEPSEKPILA